MPVPLRVCSRMGVQLLGICACSFEVLLKDGGTAIGNLCLFL